MKNKLLFVFTAIVFVFAIARLSADSTRVSAETYSGDCGSGVSWELDTSTKVLTVYGTGEMDDYSAYLSLTTAQWGKHYLSVQRVIVKNGVTSIGDWAFFECTEMIEITLPDSVKTIGKSAFKGCRGLSEIILPSSVKTIGANAFEGCSALTSITIPSSVTDIGHLIFFGAPSVKVHCSKGSLAEQYCIDYSINYDADLSDGAEGNTEDSHTRLIVLICASVLVLIVVICAVSASARKKKKKRKTIYDQKPYAQIPSSEKQSHIKKEERPYGTSSSVPGFEKKEDVSDKTEAITRVPEIKEKSENKTETSKPGPVKEEVADKTEAILHVPEIKEKSENKTETSKPGPVKEEVADKTEAITRVPEIKEKTENKTETSKPGPVKEEVADKTEAILRVPEIKEKSENKTETSKQRPVKEEVADKTEAILRIPVIKERTEYKSETVARGPEKTEKTVYKTDTPLRRPEKKEEMGNKAPAIDDLNSYETVYEKNGQAGERPFRSKKQEGQEFPKKKIRKKYHVKRFMTESAPEAVQTDGPVETGFYPVESETETNCPYCGSIIPINATFCAFCGCKLKFFS